jgi:hypothetical protein
MTTIVNTMYERAMFASPTNVGRAAFLKGMRR